MLKAETSELKSKIKSQKWFGIDIANELIEHVILPFLPLRNVSFFHRSSRDLKIFSEERLTKLCLMEFYQAIVDGDKKRIKTILKAKPGLLQEQPKTELLIQSKLTWQTFYVGNALKFATQRKQFDIADLLLPYFENSKEKTKTQWKVRKVSIEEKNNMQKK